MTTLAGTLSFNDVLNGSSFSEWFADQLSNFTPVNVLIALVAALLAGVIISAVYKRTYHGVLYSPSFGVTLIMLCMVTAPVVMCIGSNVALSMGMVGALSIVRFRTAVKDPLDTAYMFWSLTMGILIGANAYVIAVVAVLGIGVIMLIISNVHLRTNRAYLLVVHYDDEAEDILLQKVHKLSLTERMRSKTRTAGGTEITIEVQLHDEHRLINAVLDTDGVHDATLVACQSETGA